MYEMDVSVVTTVVGGRVVIEVSLTDSEEAVELVTDCSLEVDDEEAVEKMRQSKLW